MEYTKGDPKTRHKSNKIRFLFRVDLLSKHCHKEYKYIKNKLDEEILKLVECSTSIHDCRYPYQNLFKVEYPFDKRVNFYRK